MTAKTFPKNIDFYSNSVFGFICILEHIKKVLLTIH